MPAQPIGSRMAIMGHPIHPVLIHFPVAALIGAFATDLAYWWTEDFFWARAGFWLVLVGMLGGWLSGIIGMIDLATVKRIRRLITGWCHALLAVMLLSLASLNWLLRWGEPEVNILPWGLLISTLSTGLIAVTGYLGGQLVYEYGVGVDIEEALGRDVKP